MRFTPTAIAGVVEIVIEWDHDERGRFGRTFCSEEFAQHGLNGNLAQCSLSTNEKRGTVRGFHLQAEPHAEAKLVHCIAGRLFDVALDLRPGSPTYGRHHAVELSAASERMLYVPEGCAHAFQTLEEATALIYYISVPYRPENARGVVWDDPALGIRWPLRDVILSKRDRQLPRLENFRP